MTYFTLKIQNGTNLVEDTNLFILGKGINPNHSSQGIYNPVESFLKFDSSGQAGFVTATKGMDSSIYAAPLSSFPKDGDCYLLRLPKTTGGRLYLAINKAPALAVKEGLDTAGNPVSLTIAEPDPFNSNDPSYAIIYDKIEYTYNDDGVWIDTTAVDFFCMPLSLTLGTETVGLTRKRSEILNTCKQGLTGEWAKCYLSVGDSVLRVVAPNKAFGRATATENFNTSYLKPYIQAVWEHYQTNELVIDCSELVGFQYPLTDIAGGKLTNDNCMFTGSVQSDGQTFRFTNSTNDVINIMPLPLSNQVFGCDDGPMTAVKNTACSVIVRNLAAAMNVGLMPFSGTVTLNKDYYMQHAANFYTPNPNLPSGIGTGPWYNQYAKLLHSFNEKVYAFAFDDAVGQDSTLHTTNANDSVTLMVGDMSGTVIPSDSDETIYDVTFNIPAGTSGYMINTNDGNKKYTFAPGPLDITKVKSPFTIVYNHGNGDMTYTLNLKFQSVMPSDGIVIHAPKGTSVTVDLPGVPALV